MILEYVETTSQWSTSQETSTCNSSMTIFIVHHLNHFSSGTIKEMVKISADRIQIATHKSRSVIELPEWGKNGEFFIMKHVSSVILDNYKR